VTKPDLMHLSCAVCGWVIPADLSLGVVEQHFVTEHPEHVKEDGAPKIDLEMVAVCTKCNEKMPIFATLDEGDHWTHTYNCEPCGRSYTINQNKAESA
jgi:hypothetical protein